MITIKYSGGLGNQIFQYIFGLTKAKELGVDVDFDMSFFKKNPNRPYQMDIFGIETTPNKDFRIQIYWKLRKFIKKDNFLGLNIYRETSFLYEEKSGRIEDNTFIEGFFQSAKYFDETFARNVLTFKKEGSAKTQEIMGKMRNENSVSIHIRRGDYVQKTRYKSLFNQLTLEHYARAIEIIKEKVENPTFYIFSDDPDWVKENLKVENATYISHNSGDDSWQDLMLMANAKHNIIANSSFSYWGAMLNNNENKIVIAPEIWFSENKPDQLTKDIYPENWTKL
ncbi:alpha-1,2-fucosyltransferase [bacterium]|nr:alpha-1,2-fucosyltransferase [bacterium]